VQSIQRRLLVWILGALSVGAIVLVIVSYFVALSEMSEILDDNLKQVALAVGSHQISATQAEGDVVQGYSAPPAEMDFAILSWSQDGRLLFASDPRLVLPFDTVDHSGLTAHRPGIKQRRRKWMPTRATSRAAANSQVVG